MNKTETVLLGEKPVDADEKAAYATTLALVIGLVGVCMAVGGIHLLFGLGWSLIAGAVPTVGLSALIFRGLQRGA